MPPLAAAAATSVGAHVATTYDYRARKRAEEERPTGHRPFLFFEKRWQRTALVPSGTDLACIGCRFARERAAERRHHHARAELVRVNERSRRAERVFNIPVLTAALLVVPAIVLEYTSAHGGWRTVGIVLNWSIWFVFALEFVVMLAVVPSRTLWLRSHPLEVVIVFLTPPFLPASLQAARALRLLRLLRLVRLAEMGKRMFSLEGVRYAALLTLLVVLGGGAAFSALERGRTAWDGVFWAFATVSTGDSGNITPVTTGGRLIAIIVMVVGTGFLAVLTAAIAQRFLSRDIREEAGEVEAEVAHEIASAEADVLRELRSITARLQELERVVERRISTPPVG